MPAVTSVEPLLLLASWTPSKRESVLTYDWAAAGRRSR